MRAYRLKSRKDEDKIIVRILKGNEFVTEIDSKENTSYELITDDAGNKWEKVGGPIGGVDILPGEPRKPTKFVKFKMDDGTEVNTEAQMKEIVAGKNVIKAPKVAEEVKKEDSKVVEIEEVRTEKVIRRGRPRGRPKKNVA